jgi:signal transduction histidine kinase
LRLRGRITLFVAITCVLPLVGLSTLGSDVARGHMAAAIEEQAGRRADQLATALAVQFGDLERVVGAQLALFPLDVLPPESRYPFAVATWRLFPQIGIVRLLDDKGADLVAPVHATEATPDTGHDLVGPERLAQFGRALPQGSGRLVVGAPYIPDGSEAGVFAAVFRQDEQSGHALAVEVSLEPLRAQLSGFAGTNDAALVVDERGEVMLAAGNSPLVDPARLRPVLASSGTTSRVDGEVIVATTHLPGRPLVAVVATPTQAADEAARTIVERTIYILVVSLGVVIVAGFGIGRSITDPVGRLSDAAVAVGGGDLSRRVGLTQDDELGELGKSFDTMTAQLAATRDENERYRARIEGFADQLKIKVEEAVRERDEAQELVVQGKQVAAVAEMGAGLAHELNNPLAGLLGLIQVVRRMRDGQPDAALLAGAEEQALRCKNIVATMLRFTGEGQEGERERVDLVGLVRDVNVLAEAGFRQRELRLELHLPADEVWVAAHPEQLGRAISSLFYGLRQMAAAGSTVSVYVAGGEERAEVRLEAPNVRESADDYKAAALLLWSARQVLHKHGAVVEEDTVGTARRWRLHMPRDTRGAEPPS